MVCCQDAEACGDHLSGLDLLDAARRDSAAAGQLLEGAPRPLPRLADAPADAFELCVDGSAHGGLR